MSCRWDPFLSRGGWAPGLQAQLQIVLGPLGWVGPELASYVVIAQGLGFSQTLYVVSSINSSNPPRFVNHYVTRPSRATIIIYTRTCIKVNNVIISHLTFVIPNKCPCYPLVIFFSFVKYSTCYAVFQFMYHYLSFLLCMGYYVISHTLSSLLCLYLFYF